jgi:hypothetical protein
MTRAFLRLALVGAVLALALAGCNNRSRGTGPRTDAAVDSGTTSDSGDRIPDSSTTSDTSTTRDTGTTVDTGTTGGDGDAAVAAYRSVVEAQCMSAHRCRAEVTTYFPDATDADFVEAFGADMSACLALNYPPEGQTALRNAVNAGTILFDAASTSSCASQLTGLTCEDFWTSTTPIAACDTALVGTLPNGSPCSINGECISSTCDGTMCTDPA